MKRLLVSAYAISPVRGSEHALGWEIAIRLGKYFDVTVLLCEKTPSDYFYMEEIEAYIKEYGEIENVHFVPVQMPEASKKYSKLHDKGFWPAYYWGYKCWQKAAFAKAKELHNQQKYDAAYLLNMTGFREPGYLWKLDLPFIWGPINGFHSIPFSFLRSFSRKEFILQSIKHWANEIQIATSSRAKKAAEKAALVWGVDEKAIKTLTKWKANAELMQETGLNLINTDQNRIRNYDGERCLNLVWSGIMISRKALNILIQALIRVKDLNFHLTVLGSGSLLYQLKKEAEPIQNKISWTGKLPKDEAIEMVSKSDLLIHSSLSEGTPHSILEAIGLGVPVVCHDICGMASVVNEKNGFKIPYEDFNTSVEFISDLLERIKSNPDLLNKRYETIWETTNDLTWDSKVKQIANKIENLASRT
jgi:glycosyltransferase involved in cell wall biosynthesis